MDQRNLFGGLDCQLHAVREERSHAIFADVYRQTVGRVDRAAKSIAPKHCFFSMSERTDYVQEGYSGLWAHLGSYRWICPRCGERFSSVWGFDIHGCKTPAPKHTISEYASFVTRRAMKHYQVRHIAACRDERNTTTEDPWVLAGEVRVSKEDLYVCRRKLLGMVSDPGDLVHRKAALDLVRDLIFLESDSIVRFFVESCLDRLTISEIYDEGLELGLWSNRRAAYRWLDRAKNRGAFVAYAEALNA